MVRNESDSQSTSTKKNGIVLEKLSERQLLSATRRANSKKKFLAMENEYYKVIDDENLSFKKKNLTLMKKLFKSKDIKGIFDIIKVFGPDSNVKSVNNFKFTKDANFVEFYRRQLFANSLSWAVPDKSIIESIVDYVGNESLLEIGSGSGFWSAILKLYGVKVYATDKYIGYGYEPRFTFIKTKYMNTLEAVYTHRKCKVMMSIWPPYDDEMAFHALLEFKGDKFIYIGDPRCTGTADFFRELDARWTLVKKLSIPQWFVADDHCYFYQRKLEKA